VVYPKIDPVMLNDKDGYWLASYNWDAKTLAVVGYHYWPCGSDRITNAAQKVVCFLRASGLTCEGYWSGFVQDMVCDRWNADGDLTYLSDGELEHVEGAETIALEQLIGDDSNFLQNNCEFVRLDWWDEQETS